MLENGGMMRAVRDCLILELVEKQFDSKNGLVLPNRIKTSIGKVLSVGELISTIAVGDHVLFDKYASTDLTDKEKCLRYENVLAITKV